jgi:hypothetical protein
MAFSKIRTPEQLLKFIDLYGPLTRTSPQWGDSVTACLRWARQFDELLRSKVIGPRKVASVFDAQLRLRGIKPDELQQWIGEFDLRPDALRGVQLRLRTDVLIGGLWWQLGQKLSEETNLRTCRYCSSVFEAGPGTGRHIDAAFCSKEHKVRYFSLKRSKRGRRR